MGSAARSIIIAARWRFTICFTTSRASIRRCGLLRLCKPGLRITSGRWGKLLTWQIERRILINMILSDRQIREAVKKKEILIEPFEERQIQPATYDLRVGHQGITTSTKKLVNIKEAGYLLIQPGDFAIVKVLEEITLNSQHAGRFGIRSKYTRKGLIATTGPQVDPGYHGRLIIGITNLTPKPISLPYKDDLLSVEF